MAEERRAKEEQERVKFEVKITQYSIKDPSQPRFCFCLHTRISVLYFTGGVSNKGRKKQSKQHHRPRMVNI